MLGPRPETIRGRGDTEASAGGAEEEGSEGEKLLKVNTLLEIFSSYVTGYQLELAPMWQPDKMQSKQQIGIKCWISNGKCQINLPQTDPTRNLKKSML